MKVKRTYNLSANTVAAVRELVEERHLAPSQDALVEMALEDFFMAVRHANELGLMTIVPITSARTSPRLPGDVVIPAGAAGLARPGILICSQVRTISILRIVAERMLAGGLRYLESPAVRAAVRASLAHHFGLDVRPGLDGADGTAIFRDGVGA